MSRIILSIIIVVLLTSCKNNTDPAPTIKSGLGVAISLNPSTGKEMVFNFSTGKSYSYVNDSSSEDTSDIYLLVNTNELGDYVSTMMTDRDKGSKFAKYTSKYTDSSIIAARKYFESIQSVLVDAEWTDMSVNLQKGTIILVKTKDNKYAKVLINDITTIEVPEENTTITYYVSIISFDYVYQSNGSIFLK